MPAPTVILSSAPPVEVDADVLVVAVITTPDGPRLAVDVPELSALIGDLADIGISGGQDELRRLPFLDGAARSVALIGLGSAAPSTTELRYAAGSAARQLVGVDRLALLFPAAGDDALLAVLEGAAIGAYSYTAHRSSTLATSKTPAATIVVLGTSDDADALIERATAVATAVHTVRDLVNAPPSELYPETLAAAAVSLAEGTDVEVTVFDEAALEEGGFGGILAVGGGSARPPRLVKVSYSPATATKHLALVGKGITFDTGGLTLKPPSGMLGMKYDMTGAATVLSVVLAASALRLPIRLTAWMCVAENMPSGSATRPGDVLVIRGGTTVENLNSDAEGRLVMADGLVAASEEQPDAIIDVATLTGAARVALGARYVGAMGDDELVSSIVATGAATGEPFWQMPLPADMRPMINSEIADLANVKPGNTAGGMIIAGLFLREFVGSVGEGDDAKRIPWAHLDIAGPANNDGGGYGYTPKGPTGTVVRTLVALAEEISHR